MGRRVLAFFLGMLIGMIVLLGTIAAALYIIATTVTPEDIYPDSDKFLGDLANMSLYEIYNELSKLYQEKIGITGDNGLYYTLGEFLERYHIDPVEAFGKPLSKDLLEMPIFEFLGGSKDDALNQMRASVMFSFVNLFMQTTDEDGNVVGGYFSEAAIAKLYLHTMAELLDSEKGAPYVFEEVLLVDMMPSAFPAEMPETGDKIMWAFGQSSVGRMMRGFNQNMMLQFKADGAFETVGSLTMKELLGNASTYIELIFGEEIFANLIDDNGNLIVDDVMDDLYLGRLLNYNRREISDDELAEYVEMDFDLEDRTIFSKQTDEGTTYAILMDDVAYLAKAICGEAEHIHSEDCNDDEGNISCGITEHTHDAECINFVWYNCPDKSSEHEHTEECYVVDNEVVGMMSKLASEKVKDLGNLSESVKKFTLKDVLGNDVPKYLKSIQNTKISELSSAIDKMYLGEFLDYQRQEIDGSKYRHEVLIVDGTTVVKSNGEEYVRLDDGKWYPARLNCKDADHGNNHQLACYDFVWYTAKINTETCPGIDDVHTEHDDACYILSEVEGMMGKLASERISNLSNINSTIKTFTLKDVLGNSVPGSLKAIENTPIGKLGGAINNMYLGEFLQYVKKPVAANGYAPIKGIDDVLEKDGAFIKNDGNDWYEAVFNCVTAEHTHGNNCIPSQSECTLTVHTHDYDCYDYVWYNFNCVDPDNSECDHANCYTSVNGLIGRISRLKMNELNGNRIRETVNETPLGEILDINSANGLLKELADVKIGNLSKELDALYVGIAMGYSRLQKEKGDWYEFAKDDNANHTDGNAIYKDRNSNNYYFYDALRDKYYVAVITCAKNHNEEGNERGEHKYFTCFGYLWIDCYDKFERDEEGTETSTPHVHNENCKVAKGLNAKIANLRLDELTGGRLTSIAQSLTMSDLIESEMMNLTDDNKNKLNTIFGNSDWENLLLTDFMSALLDKIKVSAS